MGEGKSCVRKVVVTKSADLRKKSDGKYILLPNIHCIVVVTKSADLIQKVMESISFYPIFTV